MKYYITALMLSLFFVSCSDIAGGNCKNGCKGVDCTEEFKMITAKVVDSNGDPIVLDTYELYYTDSQKSIDKVETGLASSGNYVIATDGMMDDLDCDGTSITFSYDLDNQKIVREFLIGKDCCHIVKKGNTALEMTH